MDIFALANQKGGVRKTTVTLGLAAALAADGVRVLVVDIEPQASATKVLGVDVRQRGTVADALLEPERFALDDVVATYCVQQSVSPIGLLPTTPHRDT